MKQFITFSLLFLSNLIIAQTEETFNDCGTDLLPENILAVNEEFENYFVQSVLECDQF